MNVIQPPDHRWTVFDFEGADIQKAKGTPKADYTGVIKRALESGEKVEFPSWEYPFRSGVVKSKANASIDVHCSGGAKFIAGLELGKEPHVGIPGTGEALIKIYPDQGSIDSKNLITFQWNGGTFDSKELLAAYGQASGIGGFVFHRIAHFWQPTFQNIIYDAGTTPPDGENFGRGHADSAISTHQCFAEKFLNCMFIGSCDAAVYISGDLATSPEPDYRDIAGVNAVMAGCTGYKCQYLLGVKRAFGGTRFVNNYMSKGVNGVQCGSVGGHPDSHGKDIIIANNFLHELQGAPIIVVGGTPFIHDNHIVNFGAYSSDNGKTKTPARTAAIRARSTERGMIHHNSIKQTRNYATPRWGDGRGTVGIILGKDSGYSFGATDMNVDFNTIIGTDMPVQEEAGVSRAAWRFNRYVGSPDVTSSLAGKGRIASGNIGMSNLVSQ